jgi:hypothetical protein
MNQGVTRKCNPSFFATLPRDIDRDVISATLSRDIAMPRRDFCAIARHRFIAA